MTSILIICYSELHRDPRVLRQIEWLASDFKLITFGFSDAGSASQFVQASQPYQTRMDKLRRFFWLALRRYSSAYWTRYRTASLTTLQKYDFDLIIANEIDAVPLARRLGESKRVPIIFDAHEYYFDYAQVESWKERLKRQEIQFQFKTYVHEIDSVLTVSAGIQNIYKSKWNIATRLVRNASGYKDLHPSSVKGKLRLVHHGGAIPGRQLEKMISMMDNLDDRFELHLYLVEVPVYRVYAEQLRSMASEKVYFHDPVPTNQIPEVINEYDIGVYLLPSTTINQRFALPNKFFEFVQARLALAIGPSEEMADYVRKFDLGIVASENDPLTLAAALRNITESQVQKFKRNSHEHARTLSSDSDKDVLLQEVNTLLK